MEFLVTGLDGSDELALERRLSVREAHLELGKRMVAEGSLLYAAAILDENEKMVGSSMVVSFPSRAELEAWLEIEPYVTGKVWQSVNVVRCKPGAAFQK